ncbi:MAG TPA: glycosyltransferase family 2 protein [Novosphingobium sp.]|nr:glycosyltransferase family 2 protein [Novosphingobium sp.]
MYLAAPTQPSHVPLVSLLMVARNSERFINEALLSARRQTMRELEIVVIDDGSTDATLEIASRHAHADPRVRVYPGPQAGLAAVRNCSLRKARAPWAAILDSDDLLHPRHVEHLYAAAIGQGVQMAAANMLCFHEGGGRGVRLFAEGRLWRERRCITHAQFVRAGRLNSPGVQLGYLKPLFNLEFMRANRIEYDPRLRIGEDYEFVNRALAAGARYGFLPPPTYFYRRHDASTSHRVSRRDLVGLLALARPGEGKARNLELLDAIARRRQSLEDALAHVDTVDALKRRDWRTAVHLLRSNREAAGLLVHSALEGSLRRLRSAVSGVLPRGEPDQRPTVLVIGRPPQGSATALVKTVLSRRGYRIVTRTVWDWRDGVGLARSVRRADLILLADSFACEAAPFALAPRAPWVGEADLPHALIDLRLGLRSLPGVLDVTSIDEDTLISAIEGARRAKCGPVFA